MEFQFEASGKIKKPTAEELAAADANPNALIIALDQGTLADGTPYWAYISVRPSQYETFARLAKSGAPKVLTDYGEILCYGFDAEVPQDIRDKMREGRGCDEHCLDKLKQDVLTAQATFLQTQEQKRIEDIVSMLKHNHDSDPV